MTMEYESTSENMLVQITTACSDGKRKQTVAACQ